MTGFSSIERTDRLFSTPNLTSTLESSTVRVGTKIELFEKTIIHHTNWLQPIKVFTKNVLKSINDSARALVVSNMTKGGINQQHQRV